MEAYKLTCPHCGASLEPKDGLDTFFCTYCGGKIILDKMSDAAYKARVDIKRIEHEAKVSSEKIKQESAVKTKEYERDVALKKNEYQNEKDKRKQVMILLLILIVLNCIVWFFLAGVPYIKSRKQIKQLEKIEYQLNQDIEAEKYDSALLKANQLYYDSRWSSSEKNTWNNKRENYINMILEKKREIDKDGVYIAVPESSVDLEDEDYSKVVEKFKSAGFKNVTAQITSEDKGFLDFKNTVEHITISGKSTFSKGDTFEQNSQIIVYYYSKD